MPSADRNIIESLLLASIAAHLSSQTIYEIALTALSPEESLAISCQRTAHVFSSLKNRFIHCILNPIKENIKIILQRIHLMIHELYDPNYRERRRANARLMIDFWTSMPQKSIRRAGESKAALVRPASTSTAHKTLLR